MTLTKSYYNVRQKKWYLTAEDAAEWTPGPCVVWEITGHCPMGAKCTCAHLDREALNAKNQRNCIGNYVEATTSARCKYVLKQIRDGAWSSMKGLVRAEAPCLVELLRWLPAQQSGKIDVDVVQSFIAANKPVIEIAELSNEEELEAQNLLDEMLIECEEVEAEIFARTPAWAPNGDVPTEKAVVDWEFDNFQQEEESQWAFLTACQMLADLNDWIRLQEVNAQLELLRAEEQRQKEAAKKVAKPARNWAVLVGAGAVKAPTVAPAVRGEVVVHDDCADYKWVGMDEEKKFGLM
jgi:hypothetical protein